jgi:hypothetical protein
MKALYHVCAYLEAHETQAAEPGEIPRSRDETTIGVCLNMLPTNDGDRWVLQLSASFGTIVAIVGYCPFCGSKLTIPR